MSEMPFLSVIMPVYNAENYLDESISSILNQKMQDLELILVNDCSSDRSREICEKYAQKDKRIITIHLEKNGGAGNARNVGIQKARGQYIAFMDSDDFIDKDLYEQARQIAEKEDLDMVVWGLTEEYYDKTGKCYCKNELHLENMLCKGIKDIKETVIRLEEKTLFGYQWNRLYRSEIIKKNHIEFEKVVLYEDYFFNLKVAEHIQTMAVLANCGYHYMKRANESITTRFVPEYFELSTRRIESMYHLYCQWDYYNNTVRDILGQRYLRYILAALAKSYDERAGFDRKKRKEFVREISSSNLYRETSMNCNAGGGLGILQKLLNKKSEALCLQMGKVVWIAKEKSTKSFNKIRKYR